MGIFLNNDVGLHTVAKLKIIALIPAYNGQDGIRDVIPSTKLFVDEIIVINDVNTDSTQQVAEQAGAIISGNILNRGLGGTIKQGYKKALDQSAGTIARFEHNMNNVLRTKSHMPY